MVLYIVISVSICGFTELFQYLVSWVSKLRMDSNDLTCPVAEIKAIVIKTVEAAMQVFKPKMHKLTTDKLSAIEARLVNMEYTSKLLCCFG